MSDDASPASADDDISASLEVRIRALSRHLEATAELPIDRRTNRWLGEAEAVARDLATSDLDSETTVERVETVRRLLSEVDETGHPGGDDHLEAATRICTEVLEDDDQEDPTSS
ncbi:hypothetical protein [Natrinema salsiterrestre]|uniref:DUF8152 domain-containing protein n=1 Tax=Natrinema salsiterrestre TaxID=2950540 RepID=A0A9Q4L3L0_9EURY|nr:hypothetical protein [Natrinema salsiterrestre]MDF9746962.1 hypothetical protein [Natrinema salsiterrestre]